MAIRKDGGEFYETAQRFVELDALRGRVGSFAVLLSDPPCQVLACRVDSLTYRWWRRQRGRHHREARAREAQIEGRTTNSRRATNPNLEVGICGEHGGEPSSVQFCYRVGMNYVSCSPYRVPIARLAAAQAAIAGDQAEMQRTA